MSRREPAGRLYFFSEPDELEAGVAAGADGAVEEPPELDALGAGEDEDVSLEVFAADESFLLSLFLPSVLLSPTLPSPPVFGFELP